MDSQLTVAELEARWETVLEATQSAAAAHPTVYRELKAHAAAIVVNPIDISEYFPTVEKLVEHLTMLVSSGQGSIFELFRVRLSPTTIWQVRMLRMECNDLLAHLDAFDRWRREKIQLRIVPGAQ